MPNKANPPKLAEIAERITAHLKRMERNPEIERGVGFRLMYSRAWDSGPVVRITYVGQGSIALRKADALKYLEWLDAGNNGRHWEALREVQG